MKICRVKDNFEPKFNVRIFKRDLLEMRTASYRTFCDTIDAMQRVRGHSYFTDVLDITDCVLPSHVTVHDMQITYKRHKVPSSWWIIIIIKFHYFTYLKCLNLMKNYIYTRILIQNKILEPNTFYSSCIPSILRYSDWLWSIGVCELHDCQVTRRYTIRDIKDVREIWVPPNCYNAWSTSAKQVWHEALRVIQDMMIDNK